MSEFVKTVKLRLHEPNRSKREKISEAMRQSAEVANEAAKRLPSIPLHYIKNPKTRGSPLYRIVQDLRNDGITINAACIFEAVHKARESCLAMRKNRIFIGVPKFEGGFVRLHNRDNIDEFFKKDGTYYVSLRLFPREKITLPFFRGDYQNYFLEQIIKGDLDYGAGEIVNNNEFYTLNLAIKKEIDVDYEPTTFIGVDLGLNVLAWAVALDSNEVFLGQKHFSGKQAGWIRDRFLKKRERLQREGNLKLVKKIRDREHRWIENQNHVISRGIVDFASCFDDPVIILERIDGRMIRKRVGDTNPSVYSWTHGALRNFIGYKALEEGILTRQISPRNTSRKCPKCDFTSKESRREVHFKCIECGYQNHADFVGAWNIARQKI